MNNVTDFPGNKPVPKAEEIVAVCGHCGCLSFFLNLTMAVDSVPVLECANCGEFSSHDLDIDWVKKSKPDETPAKDAAGMTYTSALGSAELAKASVFRKTEHRYKTNSIAILISFDNEGGSSLWFDVKTDEQKEWALEKLQSVIDHVKKLDTRE